MADNWTFSSVHDIIVNEIPVGTKREGRKHTLLGPCRHLQQPRSYAQQLAHPTLDWFPPAWRAEAVVRRNLFENQNQNLASSSAAVHLNKREGQMSYLLRQDGI